MSRPGAPLDANKAVVRAVVDEVFNAHDLGALERWYAEGYRDHNPLIPPGRDGYRRWFEPLLVAFPDLTGTVEDLIAEGDKVVARTRWRATHRGELLGIAATGRRIDYGAIDVFRIVDGRVAEHWDQVDNLTLLQQLGVLPPLA